MLPIVGRITPYKRLCGALFIVVAVVAAPYTYFVARLFASETVAAVSVWGWLALFAGIVFVPGLRRTSGPASFVALGIALAVVAGGLAFDMRIRSALAYFLGFYKTPAVWEGAQLSGPWTDFRHPLGGYTISIPSSWVQKPGPLPGTMEFVLEHAEHTQAVLRPSCALDDRPLAVQALAVVEGSPQRKYSCSQWRGLQACLFKEPAAHTAEAMSWEWIAQDPDTQRSVLLSFILTGRDAEQTAYAIINSLQPASVGFPLAPCPQPLEWVDF